MHHFVIILNLTLLSIASPTLGEVWESGREAVAESMRVVRMDALGPWERPVAPQLAACPHSWLKQAGSQPGR